MKYKVTGTIEVDDVLLAILAAVDDPHDETSIADFIDTLLVNESSWLIHTSDVQVEEIEDENNVLAKTQEKAHASRAAEDCGSSGAETPSEKSEKLQEVQVIERPEVATERHLKYLDGLEESDIDMFKVGPYLVQEFRMSEKDAVMVLVYWLRCQQEDTTA